MRRSGRILVLSVLASVLAASAHLCNNIYRTPDRLVVKPEKQVATVDGEDRFRVFIQNNYPTYLNNIRLTAQAGGNLRVTVTPESVRQLKAGERTAVTVRLVAPQGTPKGEYPLKFAIAADNIGFRAVEEPSRAELEQSANPGGNLSHVVLAAESLTRLGDRRGADVLYNMARRGDRDYRVRAIRALGVAGDASHAQFLRGLLRDNDGSVRGNALLALGLLKDPPATFAVYGNDRDEFVRACAIAGWSLSRGANPNLDSALRAGLQSDNVYVRIACGWALAAQRDADAIAALERAFRTDNPMQRVTAGDAMVEVATRPGNDVAGQQQ